MGKKQIHIARQKQRIDLLHILTIIKENGMILIIISLIIK